MQKQLYRKESLEHINSPEELHDFLCVTHPRLWMILSTIVVLLVGFLVYASTATVENAVPIKLKLHNFELPEEYGGGMHTMVYADLPLSYDDLIKTGMGMRIGREKGTISAILDQGNGMISVLCEMESYYIPLPDGEYDGEVIVEETTPISFLWQ